MKQQMKEAIPVRNRSYVYKYMLGAGMPQVYIENCLASWVIEYKRHTAWIDLTEKVLANPRYLSQFGVDLYTIMLERVKKEKAKCQRKIKWLGQLHDQATGQLRFCQPLAQGYIDAEEIKARTDCRELAAKYFEVKDRGKYAVGLCPFHREKSPSFYAYDNGFHCFGCQWSGDAFKFVQQVENISFKEALQKVGQV